MKQIPLFVTLLVTGMLGGLYIQLLNKAEQGLPVLGPLIEDVRQSVVNVSAMTGPDNTVSRDKDNAYSSLGSGVIIDGRSGRVITNYHVVKQTNRIAVKLSDGRVVAASLVSVDPDTDVALLEIKARGLQSMQMADSDKLQVGDPVLAIGNPFGLGQAVTFGIVSALGGALPATVGNVGWIQTDALINPGNSGGALINMKGELVGMNAAMLAPGGNNAGIGFAVPANLIKQVIDKAGVKGP